MKDEEAGGYIASRVLALIGAKIEFKEKKI